MAVDPTREQLVPAEPDAPTRSRSGIPMRRFARALGVTAERRRRSNDQSRTARPREIREGGLPEAARRRDARYRRSLAVADIAAATAALVVGVLVLGADSLNPLALAAIPFVVVVGKVTGLYDRDQHVLRRSTLDEVPALFQSATLYAFLIWLAGDGIVEGTFGRDQAVAVWGLLFLGLFATRSAARVYARHTCEPERCLIIGDYEAAGWLARKVRESSSLRVQVVGRVPLEEESPTSNGLPVLGELDELDRTLEVERVDRAIIALNGSFSDEVLDLVRRVKATGVKVSVLPRLLEVIGSTVEWDDVDGIPLLGLRRYGLARSSRTIKRGLDLAVSGTLVVVLAPVLGMIALAIKLDSSGSVLFRQRRMGSAGVPFRMLKFRTMVDGAEAQREALMHRNEAGGGLFKIEDDPRITRVGRFLRSSSLDELPQLFNVLRGDMSLVGPRPLVLDEDERILGLDRRRLVVPPGMTGLWQILGSARIPMDEMVKLDYMYGANWSLWVDVKILLRTIPFVVGRRGL
jgi:exopolysaccharide biosynthesis polyprenyl glycosylphosphotransferase